MSHCRFAKLLLVGLVSIILLSLAKPAHAAGVSVTYDGFTGSCSATGTSILAVGHSTGVASFNGKLQLASNVYNYVSSLPLGTFNTSFTVTFTSVSWPASIPLPYTLTVTIAVIGGQTTVVNINCHSDGTFDVNFGGGVGRGPLFTDGRINNDDAGETVAIYCSKGDVTVFAIFEGKGYLAFKVTKAELDKLPKHPAQNLLVKEAKGARLYKLTTGELQVNRASGEGTEYVYRWSGCGE
jgi:hypothetical protein